MLTDDETDGILPSTVTNDELESEFINATDQFNPDSKNRVAQRPVTLENQSPTPPTNVPDANIRDTTASKAWALILNGNVGGYWKHIVDGFFFFSKKAVDSSMLWPRDVIMLLRVQFVLILITLGSAIALTVLVNNNTFNMQMEFTFDKLIGGSYPAAPTVVGTVKIGWFLTAAFWFSFLAWFVAMLWPNYYLKSYIRDQIYQRKDNLRAFVMSGMISMFLIVLLGVIGVTNVPLIVLFVCTFIGIYLKNHLVIPMHYAAAYSVLDALAPPFIAYSDEGPTIVKDTTMYSYTDENGKRQKIDGYSGAAKQAPLGLSKNIVDFIAYIRSQPIGGEQAYPIMSSYEGQNFKRTLRHYATGLTHAISPFFYTFFDELLPVLAFTSLFLVYYASALQNDSNAFKWSVHFYFWWIFVSLLADHIFTRICWSNLNLRQDIKHSVLKGKRAFALAIDWVMYSGIEWAYWTVSFVVSAFILLAPYRNLAPASTLPPY